MKNIQKIILLFVLALPLLAFAPQKGGEKKENGKQKITQRDYNNTEVEMADTWRANGKIYVVIATIASLIGGIVFYLVILDRKVAKLEHLVNE